LDLRGSRWRQVAARRPARHAHSSRWPGRRAAEPHTQQHVADPARAIAEMRRVIKPGGCLVCAEPDGGTFVIDCDDADTAGLVGERWKNLSRNLNLGRRLPHLLRRERLGVVLRSRGSFSSGGWASRRRRRLQPPPHGGDEGGWRESAVRWPVTGKPQGARTT
jgi:SAM-dependent methyltransferase